MSEEKKPGPVWRFVQEHPYFICMALLTVLPLLGITGIWAYLRLTVRDSIARELRAQGLPANGLELETWKHPKDDGGMLFWEAMTELETLHSRIGLTEFYRLRDDRRAKPPVGAPSGTEGAVLEPAAASTQQEMREQIQALADAYKTDAAAYETLFTDLAPIHAKMAQAATHEGVSHRAEYRKGHASNFEALLVYQVYHTVVARQAEYEAFARGDAKMALTRLQQLWIFNRRFHCFQISEHHVMRSVDLTVSRTLGRILCCSGLSAETLRSIGAQLMKDDNYAQLRKNLPQMYAGEMALRMTFFNDLWTSVRAMKMDIPPAVGVWLALTQDLDRQACYNQDIKEYQMAMLPFPKLRPLLPPPRAGGLRFCGSCSGFWPTWEHPFWVDSMARFSTAADQIRGHYQTYAGILQTGIAATVAGERLEGTPWPQNLEDARFPRDPYTGLAFRILIDADSVYIWSPGADGKDSGLVPTFHRTGCMKDSREVPACANEDDVVFHLSRAVYEPGRR